jgi:hypothetical protein
VPLSEWEFLWGVGGGVGRNRTGHSINTEGDREKKAQRKLPFLKENCRFN